MPETDFLSQTKAELPTAGVRHGLMRFCTDGRKGGEGVGSGTGVWVYADVVDGTATWKTVSADAEVTV